MFKCFPVNTFMLAWKKYPPLLVLQITATHCMHVDLTLRRGRAWNGHGGHGGPACTFCPLMVIRYNTYLSHFFSDLTVKELETKCIFYIQFLHNRHLLKQTFLKKTLKQQKNIIKTQEILLENTVFKKEQILKTF